jgi:hypothetical protein
MTAPVMTAVPAPMARAEFGGRRVLLLHLEMVRGGGGTRRGGRRGKTQQGRGGNGDSEAPHDRSPILLRTGNVRPIASFHKNCGSDADYSNFMFINNGLGDSAGFCAPQQFYCKAK